MTAARLIQALQELPPDVEVNSVDRHGTIYLSGSDFRRAFAGREVKETEGGYHFTLDGSRYHGSKPMTLQPSRVVIL